VQSPGLPPRNLRVHPKVPEAGGILEAFAVEVASAAAKERVTRLLTDVGEQGTIRRFGDRKTDFEFATPGGKLSDRQAWDVAYALRALPGVRTAEPLFATGANSSIWSSHEGRSGVVIDPRAGDMALPESADPDWALDVMRVKEAWTRFFLDPSKPPGHDVRIGHPDTGYQDHPEIADRMIGEDGYDFLHDDPDAHDDLERPNGVLLPNPGHGTGTSSVIVSPAGAQHEYAIRGWVSGVAPGARIVPLRASHSVLLFSNVNLARAIEYAATHRVHVISISMGGLFSWRLKRAIAFARERGVIICCAAGNYAPFVGWPAAYDEVIACAASNAQGGVWRWGCHGSAVDVTAPGESVWRATVERRDGELAYGIGCGSETSYAAAHTAGVAALWVSYHGFDALVERYGARNVPIVFSRILRDSCVSFPGWQPGEYGAGIIDAVRTLEAPLPDIAVEESGLEDTRPDDNEKIESAELATFAHLFAIDGRDVTPASRTTRLEREGALEQTLSALLRTTPR
jgi:serine protease